MIVVGGGVIGLTCALSLLRAGHRVTVWAARLSPHTTSDVAAAFWFPYAAKPLDRVLGWAADSHRAFAALADDPATGVRMVEAFDLDRQPREGDPWWARSVPAVRPLAAHELPPGFVSGHAFDAPIIDPRRYLPWLRAQVIAAGGEIVVRRIASLDEATATGELVVHCAGLGAAELARDPDVHPIRGQLVHVADPGLDRVLLDESGPHIGYVVPRGDDCVLGGTAAPHDDERTARPAEAADILARCIALEPRLRGATRLADVVGLRPGRSAVRLEAEVGPRGTIVHCYGHGGAGVTLSWGCAHQVVALVEAQPVGRRPEAIG